MEKNKIKHLIFALGDLEEASFSLQKLIDLTSGKSIIEKNDVRLARCFEASFIIALGRAFRVQVKNGTPLYDLKSLDLKILPHEVALRKKIMLYRDKVIAHSDAGYVKIDMHINKDVGNGVGIAFPQYFRGIYLSDDEQERAVRLLNKYKNAIVGTLIRKAQVQMTDFESLKEELIDPEDLKLLHQLETE